MASISVVICYSSDCSDLAAMLVYATVCKATSEAAGARAAEADSRLEIFAGSAPGRNSSTLLRSTFFGAWYMQQMRQSALSLSMEPYQTRVLIVPTTNLIMPLCFTFETITKDELHFISFTGSVWPFEETSLLPNETSVIIESNNSNFASNNYSLNLDIVQFKNGYLGIKPGIVQEELAEIIYTSENYTSPIEIYYWSALLRFVPTAADSELFVRAESVWHGFAPDAFCSQTDEFALGWARPAISLIAFAKGRCVNISTCPDCHITVSVCKLCNDLDGCVKYGVTDCEIYLNNVPANFNTCNATSREFRKQTCCTFNVSSSALIYTTLNFTSCAVYAFSPDNQPEDYEFSFLYISDGMHDLKEFTQIEFPAVPKYRHLLVTVFFAVFHLEFLGKKRNTKDCEYELFTGWPPGPNDTRPPLLVFNDSQHMVPQLLELAYFTIRIPPGCHAVLQYTSFDGLLTVGDQLEVCSGTVALVSVNFDKPYSVSMSKAQVVVLTIECEGFDADAMLELSEMANVDISAQTTDVSSNCVKHHFDPAAQPTNVSLAAFRTLSIIWRNTPGLVPTFLLLVHVQKRVPTIAPVTASNTTLLPSVASSHTLPAACLLWLLLNARM